MGNTLLDILHVSPVIPVIVIERLDDAVPLARALVAGGLRVLEVTLRSAHGMAAIRAIAEQVPDAIVGVGTLGTAAECLEARDAGAVFGASSGTTMALVQGARAAGLPLLAGVMTPSDVLAARAVGLRTLKLFPAVPAGGVTMLNALAGPLPDVTFCPTGGITPDSAADFLACRNVACVGGSWLTPRGAVEAGDWHAITALASAASGLRRAHPH